jgi:hypothetical protein
MIIKDILSEILYTINLLINTSLHQNKGNKIIIIITIIQIETHLTIMIIKLLFKIEIHIHLTTAIINR